MSALRAAAALARGDVPPGLARGNDGGFTGTTAGRDYHYVLTCHTANGAAVAPCGPTSTGAAVRTTWSSELELPYLAVSIAHDATWQLTGITRSIAHVDGIGHLAYDTRDNASGYHYRYDATYHVVVDDQRAIGGDIELAISTEHTAPAGTVARRFAIDAQLTFSPDDTAELTLDGTRHYRIALATGAVTPIAPSLAARFTTGAPASGRG
ncbi:MAG TPA: hypothetical protein VH165_29515 [Kofleriaceae bacterium]|nr:hypothetical protein [Kofleriaceae bacterium]